MPGLALEFHCLSHFLFGLLQATAAKDTTAVAEPEVRIRVQATDNQTQKRRSELGVRKSWSAQSNLVCRQYHGRAESLCLSPRHEIMIVTSQKNQTVA
jgi:hypothetical protein